MNARLRGAAIGAATAFTLLFVLPAVPASAAPASVTTTAATVLAPVADLSADTVVPSGSCESTLAGHLSCDLRHGRSLSTPSGSVSPMAAEAEYTPSDLQHMYGIDAAVPVNATIGIVDVGQDPYLESDLAKYRDKYNLGDCTKASGCLSELAVNGHAPVATKGWIGEISLDVEAVSSLCPTCHITLVDAASSRSSDLYSAIKTLAESGVHYVSMSFGGSYSSTLDRDDATWFGTPNTIYVGAAGDDGYDDGTNNCNGTDVCYPAAAPQVVAAGGVSAIQTARGFSYTAWDDSGSGCAEFSNAPAEQLAATGDACDGSRALSDVSALADPETGLVTYDTIDGWVVSGGTSLATPLIATMYAVAGNTTSPFAGYANEVTNPSLVSDVTSGETEGCDGSKLCAAGTGWDGPTGIGVPTSPALFATSVSPLQISAVSGDVPSVVAITNVAVSAKPLRVSGASGAVTWSATGLPAGVTVNPTTGAWSGKAKKAGDYTATVTVNDGVNTPATASVDVEIVNVYSCSATQKHKAGSSLNLDCSAAWWKAATSTSGHWVALPGTWSYSAAHLPTGLKINKTTGHVSGHMPKKKGKGTFTVTMTGKPDGVLISQKEAWTITVHWTSS